MLIGIVVNLSFVLINLIVLPSLLIKRISIVVLGASLNFTNKTGDAGFGKTLAILLTVVVAGLLSAVTTKLKLSLIVLQPSKLVIWILYEPIAVGL